MLQVEVLLTEAKLAEEFLAALQQRYLPEKFFYWLPLSVKAWLDLCQGTQPYKNFSRSYQLLFRHAADIALRCVGEKTEVVSLGAGQGDKDHLVLEALRANGRTVRYRPVDSSQALLEMALERTSHAQFLASGLKADLANPQTAEVLATSADEPRLYVVLGNTLSVTDPPQFLQTLRALVRREDHVLVDGEIFNAQDTMRGYDNPVNRRFAFAPLASVGLEEGRDGALIFESEADARAEGLHLVTKHFCAARQLEISIAGRQIELEADEKIAMSTSHKYSHAAFMDMLRGTGGLEPIAEYLSEDQHFLMALAAPSGTEVEADAGG